MEENNNEDTNNKINDENNIKVQQKNQNFNNNLNKNNKVKDIKIIDNDKNILDLIILKKEKEDKLKKEENKEQNIDNINDINHKSNNINYLDSLLKEFQNYKIKTIDYFKNIIETFENKYDSYINKLIELIKQKEKEISDIIFIKCQKKDIILENIVLNYYIKNFFDKIDNIKSLHTSIFSSIESTIDILKLFLEDSSLFLERYPIENFLNKNIKKICQSLIINNINYKQLHFSSNIINEELFKLLSDNLDTIKNNNLKSLTINKILKKDNNDTIISNLTDNGNNINFKKEEEDLTFKIKAFENYFNKTKTLEIINLSDNELYTIINDCYNKNLNVNIDRNNTNNDKIIKLELIENIYFINSKIPNYNLFENNSSIYFESPNLKNLIIKKCNIFYYDFIFSLIKSSKQLKIISFEDINMTQNSFINIIKYIIKNENLLNILEYLSFEKNEISKIDFNEFKLNIFKSLKYLNFSKNELYYFNEENLKYIPNIKIIDLSYNNITNTKFFNQIIENRQSILVFFTSNLFLINNDLNKEKYMKYLIKYFSTSTPKDCSIINFSFLFDKDNLEDLNKIYFNPIIKLSLIKLDLSYNHLTCDILKKFFKNNIGLIHLKSLILCHNCIDFSFFKDVFTDCDLYLKNLKIIDLDFNNINYTKYTDIDDIENFIKTKPYLKIIYIQKNNFFINMVLDIDYEEENIHQRLKKLEEYKIKLSIEKELNHLNDNKLRKIFIFENHNI